MAFKMMGGKPLKQKTGAGIPLSMKSAAYQTDPRSARVIFAEKQAEKREDRVLDSLKSVRDIGPRKTAKLYNNKKRGGGLDLENQTNTNEFQSTQDNRTLAGGIVPDSGRKQAEELEARGVQPSSPPKKDTRSVGTEKFEKYKKVLIDDAKLGPPKMVAKPVAKQMKKGGMKQMNTPKKAVGAKLADSKPRQKNRKDRGKPMGKKKNVPTTPAEAKADAIRRKAAKLKGAPKQMDKKAKKKGGMKQMDKKAPAKQTASQKAKLPAKLVAAIKAKGPKQKMKAGMKQMDKKGGPKKYGKGPKQKESVKQEKKDLDINFLAEKMEPKTK